MRVAEAEPQEAPRRRDRRRRRTAFVVLMLSVASLGVAATGAIFTDTQQVDANTFSTGSIDISTTPATALVTASTMAPGDKSESAITVDNAGSLELRYAIQRSADDTDGKGLRDSLQLRIGDAGADGTCAFPYYNSDGTTTDLSGVDDSQVYEGTGFPGTATNTVGDAAQGQQTGDRVLAGAASEDLCFAVVLPTSAGNTLQSATTTAVFDFQAEQTANNS